ncbi:3-hydroxyacyl-CoA dehydrogenase/enoyl-CoA hydratase family protein [Candidatus Poribacteria bacterium]|nr:3-hydroxyacyl-CoA dehydrogenase/enoyl-CoA hydratase family protein [Candidatus Poribacteria bacterium]
MGSQIAAHIANVGIPCDLLDIPPTELTSEERANRLTLDSPTVRNRIAQAALDRMKNAKTRSPFYVPDAAELIRVGNFHDHAERLADADWIIEAVVENLDVKRQVHGRIDRHRRRGALVSSNTSGISIRAIAEGLSEDYQECFLGTHFFNPPRYMYLIELIPTDTTRPDIVEFISGFAEHTLGKGIVRCKDTPNFIANRIGIFSVLHTIHLMLAEGYTIDEVEAITGPPMGRPRSATFRLVDIIGLDVLVDVANNVYENAVNDEMREMFRVPDFILQMVEKGWLGEKTGGGFYQKRRGGNGSEIWTLDYNKFEYAPRSTPLSPPASGRIKGGLDSISGVRRIADAGERLKRLIDSDDRAGRFAWKCLSHTMRYTAARIPEIADDIESIDSVMKWGFNWELGIFEAWDAIGVPESVKRMKEENHTIPPIVADLLDSGRTSFYKTSSNSKAVKSSADASLIDMGDGVLCLEFHSKMNTIDNPSIEMMFEALDEVERNFEGLVIGNHADNFSVGANLALMLERARNRDWEALETMIAAYQRANMRFRLSPKPVVAAPVGMALGGGCEIAFGADRICAAAETYIGLVEVGVGLIPAAGGVKEMAIRCLEGVPLDADAELFPHFKRAFETIAYAKVSESAAGAKRIGYLREADTISINRAYHLHDAKQLVLAMVADGYQEPQPRQVFVMGNTGFDRLKSEIDLTQRSGQLSNHDVKILNQLAYVLCGGELSVPQYVSEDYLLELEREAFLYLCGEAKTHQRIEHTLKTGKPLKN